MLYMYVYAYMCSWHDKDNNGYIDSDELPSFLRAAGFNPLQPALETWKEKLEREKDGALTFPDFVELWFQHVNELQDDGTPLKMAFEFFDKDGDGTVDRDELKRTLRALGDPFTDEECEKFFRHVRVSTYSCRVT